MTKSNTAAPRRQAPSGTGLPEGAPGPADEFLELVTMKMVVLFGLLRRGGALAQRRHFDLSELEWRVMAQMTYQPLSLTGLADRLVLDRGQLSRIVKGMVERGLLTRERKPGGPEVVISLSPSGEALYERMAEWAIERDAALTGEIPAEDIAAIRRAFDHMIGKARMLLDRERTLADAAKDDES